MEMLKLSIPNDIRRIYWLQVNVFMIIIKFYMDI